MNCSGTNRWQLIFEHKNVSNGYFSRELKTTGLENPNDPTANTYSIIGWFNNNMELLNRHKDEHQRYKLKLFYKNVDSTTSELIWTQTSWITDLFITDANLSLIPDQTSVAAHDRFYGLGLSTQTRTYLDGTAGLYGFSWHSVGCNVAYGAGIPGDNHKIAQSSSLSIWGPGLILLKSVIPLLMLIISVYVCSACTFGDDFTAQPSVYPTSNPTEQPTSPPGLLIHSLCFWYTLC